MRRIFVILLFLLFACAPCLAADPAPSPNPYIKAEVRWLWGQAQFEGAVAANAVIGKPTTLPFEVHQGIRVDATILLKEISNGMAVVTVKLKLTPPGQTPTATEVNAVAKLGQSFHVELRPDETRNISLDFTVEKQPPAPE